MTTQTDCVFCGKPHFNFGDYDEGVEMRIGKMDTGEHIIVVDPPYAWSIPINFCPFCGQPIDKKPYTRPDVGSRIRQGVIVCDCGVEMRIHVISEQTINRWRVGGYKPINVYSVYKCDVNDTDAVIQFTKDEIVKQWNSRSDNA